MNVNKYPWKNILWIFGIAGQGQNNDNNFNKKVLHVNSIGKTN